MHPNGAGQDAGSLETASDMVTIKRVLCPIDFSEYSRHALDRAVSLAGEYSGSITALHVVTQGVPPRPPDLPLLYPPIVFTPEDLEQFRAHTRQFVEQQSEGAPVDVVVAVGNVAPEIVRVAEALPADMIVIGTHGRSGFDRLILGSVTERILRKARCPVLTVPGRHGPDGVYARRLFTHILCATDFSASSLAALSYASSLAQRANAQLTVLHVLEHVPTLEPVVVGVPGQQEYRKLTEAAHRKRLHEVLAAHPDLSRDMSEIVTSGKPYREILRIAAEQKNDLIVMGVHGGPAGLPAFGSTLNHVVRQATCPVLSLRA
jgi:nucleotide-binding universal stress UspA family protein